jgi:hypothetical protein
MLLICQTIEVQGKTFIRTNLIKFSTNKELGEQTEDIMGLRIAGQILNILAIILKLYILMVLTKGISVVQKVNILIVLHLQDIKVLIYRTIILQAIRGLNLVYQTEDIPGRLHKITMRVGIRFCSGQMVSKITLHLSTLDSIIRPKKSLAIAISTVHNILPDIIKIMIQHLLLNIIKILEGKMMTL